jgi:alpha-ketoglutarate-dependent 2,4-dichlorophenoxyacetate dioxygenase
MFSRADQFFHTDSSFNSLPTTWSLLSARILPPEGGNTEFVDMRAVYAELDQETKATVKDLTAIHSMAHSRKLGGYEMTPAQAAVLPPVHQKMVQIAPDGRPTLVAGSHAGAIVGWPDDKAQALLVRIIEFAKQPRFRLVHQWKPHDLLIWDNRCTLHRATPFDDFKYKRDMRRTTLLANGPDRSVQDAA